MPTTVFFSPEILNFILHQICLLIEQQFTKIFFYDKYISGLLLYTELLHQCLKNMVIQSTFNYPYVACCCIYTCQCPVKTISTTFKTGNVYRRILEHNFKNMSSWNSYCPLFIFFLVNRRTVFPVSSFMPTSVFFSPEILKFILHQICLLIEQQFTKIFFYDKYTSGLLLYTELHQCLKNMVIQS